MQINKWILISALSFPTILANTQALAQETDNLGQILKIQTNFRSFVGKPAWLLIIRDVDHGQNIPYLFDFKKGNDYFLAFTYSRNYLITVSELTFNPYDRKIKNFCDLESMGAILRGTSMDILISGDLTQNTNTYTCNVMKYTDPNFSISNSE